METLEMQSSKMALAKALKKLMCKMSFSRISVTHICDEAAVSRRNFYRYFTDKYELLGQCH